MKKAVRLVLASLLLFSLFVPTVGANEKQSISKFEVDQIKGVVLSEDMKTSVNSDATFKDVNFIQENGNVKIEGNLVYNANTYNLSLSGVLYPVRGKGAQAGNLVLGDINDTKDFNILQMRLEKNSRTAALLKQNHDFKGQTVLTLVLEHKESGERIVLQKTLQKKNFAPLFKGAEIYVSKKGIKEDQLKEKVVQLLNMNNKSDHRKPLDKTRKAELKGTGDSKGKTTIDKPISALAWTEIPVDHNELNRLFKDLREVSNHTVNLDNYNLPENLFRGSGWKTGNNFNTTPYYWYDAASAEQMSGDYGYTITQITHVHVIAAHNDSLQGYTLQTRIDDSMMLEYDHYTHEVSVFYFNFGLRYEDYQMAQGGLEGDDVYITQEVNGDLDNEPNYAKAFWGLIPYADKVYNLWEALNGSTEVDLGNVLEYEKTAQDQRLAYDDKVYRVISSNFEGHYLRSEGKWANIRGQINYSDDGYYTLMWSIQYTAYHAL